MDFRMKYTDFKKAVTCPEFPFMTQGSLDNFLFRKSESGKNKFVMPPRIDTVFT